MCMEIVMWNVYIGYCDSETLPMSQTFVLYTCHLRQIISILNWMYEGSFVLAKYRIDSYTMIFYKILYRL